MIYWCSQPTVGGGWTDGPNGFPIEAESPEAAAKNYAQRHNSDHTVRVVPEGGEPILYEAQLMVSRKGLQHTVRSMAKLVAGKLTDDELVQLALLFDEDSQDEFWAQITYEASERAPELGDQPPGAHDAPQHPTR